MDRGRWVVQRGARRLVSRKHPELVVGAWASSAPVNVQRSTWAYDATSARALGPVCLPLFQQALAYASRAYDDAEQRKALSLALFGYEWDEEWGKRSFLEELSIAATGAAQTGQQRRLCQSLEQHLESPIDGFLAYHNPPLVPDDAEPDAPDAPITSRRAMPNDVLGPGGIRRSHPSPGDGDEEGQQALLWFYQTCTELGLATVKNPDGRSRS